PGSADTHYYTTDEEDKDSKIIDGYQYEGIQGWVYADSGSPGTIPFHRLKQAKTGDDYHYVMVSRQTEYDAVLAKTEWGFSDDGIAGYIFPAGSKTPDAPRKLQGNHQGVDLGTLAYRFAHPTPSLSLRGAGPQLAFQHHYNSFDAHQGLMGLGWSHNFDIFLQETSDKAFLAVHWGDGSETLFQKDDATGKYAEFPEPQTYAQVEVVSSGNTGYDITTKDRITYSFRNFSEKLPYLYPTWITDRFDNQITLEWFAVTFGVGENIAGYGRLDSVTGAAGRRFEFDYMDCPLEKYPLVQLSRVTESALGRSVLFGYDDQCRLATFQDAGQQTTTYSYNDQNLLSNMLFPRQNSRTITYESEGTVKNIQEDGKTLATFSLTNGFTHLTTPTADLWKFQHDDNQLKQTIHPSSASSDIDYLIADHPQKPSQITDTDGNGYTIDYDDNGNVQKITARDQGGTLLSETSYTHDAYNNLRSVTDGLQHTWQSHYDDPTNGLKLMRTEDPLGQTVNYTYFDNGQIKTTTDGKNRTTHFTYDTYANLATIQDHKGNTTTFTNDAAGRTTDIRNAKHTHAATPTFHYTYDNNDNLTSATHWTNPATVYDFNENNLLESITDAKNRTTTFVYQTGRDLLEKEISPLSTIQYGYYDNGGLKTITKPDGQSITLTYDAENRLETIAYPTPGTVTLSYDDHGNLTRIADWNGDSNADNFSYDDLNRITGYTDTFGQSVGYGYDGAGRSATITYPDASSTNSPRTVTYGYYDNNRLHTVTDWLNDGKKSTFHYDDSGQVDTIESACGTTSTFGYDEAGRLDSITHNRSDNTLIASYSFVLDVLGNHESVTGTDLLPLPSPTAGSMIYSHDDENRLTQAGSVEYENDLNGNREGSSDGNSYAFNSADWLDSATTGGETISYTYDGFGNRIARTIGGTTTRYVLDLNGSMSRVLEETDTSGHVSHFYIHGRGGLLHRISASGQRYCYHYDSRGSTVAVTDGSGNIVEKYAYDEFGQVIAMEPADATNPFRYVGQYGVMDEDNGLLFMRARYYDTETGRFLSKDPLRGEMVQPGTLNRYVYALGNPMMGIDPKGQSTESWWYKHTSWADNEKLINRVKIAHNFFKTVSYLHPASRAVAIAVDAAPVLVSGIKGELDSKDAFIHAALLGLSLAADAEKIKESGRFASYFNDSLQPLLKRVDGSILIGEFSIEHFELLGNEIK
ncbi:MAG: RHS repeat protein, partial [Magnetococcales bacterium]|nr:RHS repeat protein [Magnetococcales bacterium]